MSKLDGYILAGGASRRMGRPKPEIVFGGRRLIDIAAENLAFISGERIKIVGNVQIADPPFPMIRDMPDPAGSPFPGPLFGLMAAFSDAEADWIAILACDMPFITPELLMYMAAADRADADAVIPIQPDARMQPLCALYRREAAVEAAKEAIRQGSTSLNSLIDRIDVKTIEFEELSGLSGSESFFLNLNTPSDFEDAADMITKRDHAVE